MSRERVNDRGEVAPPLAPFPRPASRSPFPASSENSISKLRERAFELAGITPEVIAAQLKKASARISEALDAVKVERTYRLGELVGEVEVEDWNTRLKAIQVLGDLYGVSASKSSLGGQNQPNQTIIQLNVPFLEQLRQQTIDITPPTQETQDESQRLSGAGH